ncbi:Avirulence protein (Avh) [Phytophthora palmivora]|uniref:RxLR effector protein n=1 Tax=Phytophthora palmivora TaxID=4796 RepID=A0A2P4YRV4_9STRA|nr:Avirulence protein (Avh) [Phytophthora palmivora]
MRLFNMTLMVLAAVLLASGTAVSNADQASVLNVDDVHSSRVLSGEDKSFLRRHPIEHDEEERGGGANMFAALKQERMKRDLAYRLKVFGRWRDYGKSVTDARKHVTNHLADAYDTFLKSKTRSGLEINPGRIHRQD